MSGEVVFAGHGLSVPEYGYDDFAKVDVRDKIVVVLAGAPRSERPDFFPSLASAVHGQSERVARELMRRGARALVFVWPPEKEALTPFRLLAEHYEFDAMRLEDAPPLLPEALISAAAFEALLKQAGRPETVAGLVQASALGRPRGFDLGLRARLRAESRLRRRTSENVVGPAPGRSGVADREGDGGLRRSPGPHGHRQAGERGPHLQRCLGRRGRRGQPPRDGAGLHPARSASAARHPLPLRHRRGARAPRLGVVRPPPHGAPPEPRRRHRRGRCVPAASARRTWWRSGRTRARSARTWHGRPGRSGFGCRRIRSPSRPTSSARTTSTS